jgi:hypothetical protein
MNPALRWILLVPAALAGAAAAYVGGVLVWNVVRLVNIMPQESFIDLAFAAVGINGAAGAAGVFAGAAVAPNGKAGAAVMMAALFALLALVSLAIGASVRESLKLSLAWHVASSVAWIGGAAAAAIHVRSTAARASSSLASVSR